MTGALRCFLEKLKEETQAMAEDAIVKIGNAKKGL